MSIKKRFCIRCGVEESSENPIINGLCVKCYIDVKGLISVPKVVEFQICKDCGAVFFKGKWVKEYSAIEEVLESIVLENVRISELVNEIRGVNVRFVTTPSWTTLVEVEVHGIVRGVEFRDSRMVKVIGKPTLCSTCLARRSKDYEAIVQIRTLTPSLSHEVKRILEVKGSKLNLKVIEVKESSEGMDIYLVDKGSARRIVALIKKHFNTNIKTSFEDVGITSKGKMRRRLIYSIHILSSR